VDGGRSTDSKEEEEFLNVYTHAVNLAALTLYGEKMIHSVEMK
jgi:hypothetical protein